VYLGVTGDRQVAHVQFDVMVDEVYVPEEVMVLASGDQTEVGVGPGVVDHISAAGRKVARLRNDSIRFYSTSI
jgi:hypothetical protein